jgi:hypothetical protein
VAWHLALHKRNSFVATVNGEVAGFSDVDDHGHVDMLFVAPSTSEKELRFFLCAKLKGERGELARRASL